MLSNFITNKYDNCINIHYLISHSDNNKLYKLNIQNKNSLIFIILVRYINTKITVQLILKTWFKQQM